MEDENPLIKRMRDHSQARASESEHAFSVRVLKVICKALDLQPDIGMDHPEFGCSYFNDHYRTFPVKLETRHVSIASVDDLIKVGLTKSKLWELFKEVWHLHNYEPIGVVVQAFPQRLWLIHNAWRLESAPGYTRLIHTAKSKNDGLIFEPLEAFLAAVKARGGI